MTIEISNRIQELFSERQRHAQALLLIDDKLTQIQSLLGGIATGPKRRGRPPKLAGTEATAVVSRNGTLADHLETVIKSSGKPLGIGELIAGVKASNYQSKAKDIRPVVSLSLIKDKRFKRVGRGVYALRSDS